MWLLDGIASIPSNDAHIVDLTIDSREVGAGYLFLALSGRPSSGQRRHGLEFAAEAAARGASAVLWEPGPDIEAPLLSPALFAAPIEGLHKLVGRIADRFFQQPSSQLSIVGITGTNGKTTCAYLAAQCLERLRHDAAYIGTLGWGRIGALRGLKYTTPDAVSVHRMLAQLRAEGVREVAMEVSSHALDQGRVDAVRFHSAAFTNLSRDHLDYHVSMRAYGEAKARLFASPNLRQAIINIGDPFGRELAREVAERVPLTAVWLGAGVSGDPGNGGDPGAGGGAETRGGPGVGGGIGAGVGGGIGAGVGGGISAGVGGGVETSGGAGALGGSAWIADRSLYSSQVALEPHGVSMEIAGNLGKLHLSTRLLGRFNAENSLVVLGCLASLGVPLEAAAAALAECTAPPGRMEVIEAAAPGRPKAVIDYAHTPDALAQALAAVRDHCRGVLWCVFGCGGDRDAGKRPMMGAVADELADQIIVTDDNPRSEDPEEIIRAITGGIQSHAFRVIHDRGAAIAAALNDAGEADVVLIAGKGHEDYQIYGTTRRSFSDRREALRYLGEVA